MPTAVTVLEPTHPDFPIALKAKRGESVYERIWTIGNVAILKQPLLGFFCSSQCPGDVILKLYDVARALRDAQIPVISGFHSPLEKECLDLLLRGKQPIVVCPARTVERMRIPTAWQRALNEERLLILSPFESEFRQPTVALAERRNHVASALAHELFVGHAEVGSKTEQFCCEQLESEKRLFLLAESKNSLLLEHGANCLTINGLVRHFRAVNQSSR